VPDPMAPVVSSEQPTVEQSVPHSPTAINDSVNGNVNDSTECRSSTSQTVAIDVHTGVDKHNVAS